jgi:tRNA U34 5-methylaminomethyl-2-thiouridine-forming methyltransferase MnmC
VQRQLIVTNDGSSSIAIPEMNVTYHSQHGAIRESMHVFIQAGLHYAWQQINTGPIALLEMGFGTGLNALLTMIEAGNQQKSVYYEAIELFPLVEEEFMPLGYCSALGVPEMESLFQTLHATEWDKEVQITPGFRLKKTCLDLLLVKAERKFDLVYFDAFAPSAQPELWTKEIFDKLYTLLAPRGIVVTYCSKGSVRRALGAAGFMVEKLPGPPGKREIVRALRV